MTENVKSGSLHFSSFFEVHHPFKNETANSSTPYYPFFLLQPSPRRLPDAPTRSSRTSRTFQNLPEPSTPPHCPPSNETSPPTRPRLAHPPTSPPVKIFSRLDVRRPFSSTPPHVKNFHCVAATLRLHEDCVVTGSLPASPGLPPTCPSPLPSHVTPPRPKK